MRMGAIGTYGEVFSAKETGGLELAVRSDAFWVRTESEAVGSQRSGRMEGSTGDATRLRVVVQGSRSFELEAESSFTPSLEVGIRHDGGDAETGAGIEIGAGTRFVRRGFAMEGAVNRLFMHEDGDYEQWGASGSVRLDSGAGGQGLSVSLVPACGFARRGPSLVPGEYAGFCPGRRLRGQMEPRDGNRLWLPTLRDGRRSHALCRPVAGRRGQSIVPRRGKLEDPAANDALQAVRDGGLGGAPPACWRFAATRW